MHLSDLLQPGGIVVALIGLWLASKTNRRQDRTDAAAAVSAQHADSRADFEALQAELWRRVEAAEVKAERADHRSSALEERVDKLESVVSKLRRWKRMATDHIRELHDRWGEPTIPPMPEGLDLEDD